MDKQRVRSLALEVLRKNPQTHVHMIENEIRQIADDFDRHDTLTLQEIVWELLVQGVLAPGKNSLNLNLPFVHVTEYGARCLDDGAARVHDPEGYAESIESIRGGSVDAVLLEHAREAQLSFLSGRLPSAMVMLSRAAERLVCLLGDALDAEVSAPKNRLESIRTALAPREIPDSIGDSLQIQLDGLRTLLDLSRSDGGEPRVPTADRDQALAYLLLFPAQCRLIYDLIGHLGGNGHK